MIRSLSHVAVRTHDPALTIAFDVACKKLGSISVPFGSCTRDYLCQTTH